jgi:hypothetical protein
MVKITMTKPKMATISPINQINMVRLTISEVNMAKLTKPTMAKFKIVKLINE